LLGRFFVIVLLLSFLKKNVTIYLTCTEPKDNELVSIKAYRGFRLEGTGVDRYETYEKGGSYLVGDYNIESISNLSRDLKKVLF